MTPQTFLVKKDYCDSCDQLRVLEQDEDSGRLLCSKCMEKLQAAYVRDMIHDAKFREEIRQNPDDYDYATHKEYQV